LGKSSLTFFLFLVLFSCTEDPSTIGFKGADSRFKVYYKELNIPTSVVLTDSLLTSVNGQLTNATRRLLVGKYTDPEFGVVEAEAYTQFSANDPTLIIPADAILESAVLNLTFDYYYYGSNNSSFQNFYVHELTDSILSEQPYYSTSSMAYDPTPIGVGSYIIDPPVFDTFLAQNLDKDATNDRVDTLSITLDDNYAKKLFELASSGTTDYTLFKKFRRIFKGFAIRSDGSEKLVGFDPYYDDKTNYRSRLLIYYKYPDVNNPGTYLKRMIKYSLFSVTAGIGVQGYSRIKSSHSGTLVQDLDVHKDYYPSNGLRFVEAGNPIFTKLDFSDFIKFSDTLSNMIINSAELVIDPIEAQQFPLPFNLGLKVLTDKNRFIKTSSGIPAYYTGLIVGGSDGDLIVGEQLSATELTEKFNLSLSQNTDGTYKYNEFFTSFFQRLYFYRNEDDRLLKYGLVSSFPAMGKSVNRFIFNKDKLKLKLYYTLPTTEKNQ
jgi:hypothetical protein